MNINTNISSLKTQAYLTKANNNLASAMEQLSSGKRINSAADDAAGLAISNRMNAKVSGMNVASRNSNDGISMLETAEGAQGSISNILGRMRDLAVQAANGTYASGDLTNINAEFAQLISEIGDVAGKTDFNGVKLINAETKVTLQTGANNGDTLEITFASMKADDLGVDSLAVGTQAGAQAAITAIDTALDTVSTERANMGAYINRLEFKVDNLSTNATNLSAANSRIEDADMAAASSEMTKQNVLVQAGVAMLAQANQSPQSVLKLLN